MNMTYIFGLTAVVLVIGFTRLVIRLLRIIRHALFTIEFREKFDEYALLKRDRKDSGELYMWLVARMDQMQERLGPYGILGRSAILMNTLTEMERGTYDRSNILSVFEGFTRYLSFLERTRNKTALMLLNPLSWFRTGIEYLLSLPTSFLREFHLISATSSKNGNFIFRLITAFVTVIWFILNLFALIISTGADLKPFLDNFQ